MIIEIDNTVETLTGTRSDLVVHRKVDDTYERTSGMWLYLCQHIKFMGTTDEFDLLVIKHNNGEEEWRKTTRIGGNFRTLTLKEIEAHIIALLKGSTTPTIP